MSYTHTNSITITERTYTHPNSKQTIRNDKVCVNNIPIVDLPNIIQTESDSICNEVYAYSYKNFWEISINQIKKEDSYYNSAIVKKLYYTQEGVEIVDDYDNKGDTHYIKHYIGRDTMIHEDGGHYHYKNKTWLRCEYEITITDNNIILYPVKAENQAVKENKYESYTPIYYSVDSSGIVATISDDKTYFPERINDKDVTWENGLATYSSNNKPFTYNKNSIWILSLKSKQYYKATRNPKKDFTFDGRLFTVIHREFSESIIDIKTGCYVTVVYRKLNNPSLQLENIKEELKLLNNLPTKN